MIEVQEAEKDVENAGSGIMHEAWFVHGTCILPIKLNGWNQSDCH